MLRIPEPSSSARWISQKKAPDDQKPSTKKVDNTWDWAWLYYCGTFLLMMNETVFWKTTPRKLSALMYCYIKAQGGKTEEEQNKEAVNQLMKT